MLIPDHLGTPLSPTATKVLLLGAGELGRELVASFHRFGVEVHAADNYANAPALQLAHGSHLVDLRDHEALVKLVDQVRPDYVVPECDAANISALKEIEASGIATVVPTAHAVELTVEREGIRRAASEELGLPTSRYAFASSFPEFEVAVGQMGYPCVVKPVRGSAGRGHTIIHDEDEVEPAWEIAHRECDRVMVERFVNFDCEMTLLTVRSIDPETKKAASWFCEPIGHVQRGGDLIESWQPLAMSQRALENARSVAARITNYLGGRGLFGVELFVAGDDVYFSGVSPRPHDTGMVTLATQRFSQFDLHVRAILGLPVDVTLTTPGACSVIHAEAESDRIEYSGITEALSYPEVDLRFFGKPAAYPRRRMGVALASGESTEEARAASAGAARSVNVNLS
ncbi:formate-dependent phosphoribosylglycinamide formyltransferase [Corynebacterium poyangense]|uniref:Formate-dependent phosphoribosylglycinamide formyltransferase n=1 Tax=Corynebacterium poyangense TaxID=2684405 RepID=A0A7H0SRD7_9CORY|nr:formate-dependent phosphoribosylglycinamide formyltransferase [Corynebacterium poyangense]MBZ8176546.1 formate-dependent phosphoribosylglycinamide formyltransferase [Corynebacterium poyangense]QNQ91112.1 formate-dependent phosphoribosylglycinamide formyltransferase [Corynebacterium poyangense]